MASYKETSATSSTQNYYLSTTTTTATKTAINIQSTTETTNTITTATTISIKQHTTALPERFALSRRQTTTNHQYPHQQHQQHHYHYNNNKSNNSNKLLNRLFACRQALRHLLHATIFILFALLFSDWIAQASVATALTAAPAPRYKLPHTDTPAPQQQHQQHLGAEQEPVQSIALAEDEFNASSFRTSAIATSDVVSLIAAASTAAASWNTNSNNNSINPRYVAAQADAGASGSAALITTSSIWDPFIGGGGGGAYPTDTSAVTSALPPPPPPQLPPLPPASNDEDEPPLLGDNDYYANGDEFPLPPWHAAIVCIILMLIIIGTVIGNVLVCIAVCMVRKLRRPCNYLLVSLALSDLCVALLVMPMAMLYEVLDKWNFGPILCDIWVSFDVLCCTASILNLCAISVDRYLAITKPLEYGVKRTPRRMMACVALVWLAAASISLPPLLILGNEHVDEHGTPICIVCQNFAYQIYATLGSFYIPLAVMLFVYYQIFRAARRIVLEEKRSQTHLQHALNGTGSPPAAPQPPLAHTDLMVVGGGGGGGGSNNGHGQHRHSSYGNTSLTYSTCGTLSAHHTSAGSGGGVSGTSGLLGSPHQKKLRFQLAKEKKASTTLGIIMSAFTICWLPFFILALIRPFVESETVHVPHSLSSLFLWLGYANSLLNPIIYATLNRDFRKPFQLILHLRCSSLNTMMRENYYQDQYGEPPSQRVMLGDERHGARESFL